MREEIVKLDSQPELIGSPCVVCDISVDENDEVIVCPRCKAVHHSQCWIDKGGCGRHGCRQVASRDLLPPKEEKPIEISKTPPWIIAGVIILLLTLGLGVYRNAQLSAERRASTVSVMVPGFEPEHVWEEIIASYDGPALKEMNIELLVTPGGSAYEQKLLVMMAAGDAPELVVIEYDRFLMYAERGGLVALDDAHERLNSMGIQLSPQMAEAMSFDGVIYGLPHPKRNAVLTIPASARHLDGAQDLMVHVVAELSALDDDNPWPDPPQEGGGDFVPFMSYF